ncbi:MAG: hypothetical protein ABSG74_08640 [Candidatus Bathyarchaeia archaeon]|jgi:hypothetical protein
MDLQIVGEMLRTRHRATVDMSSDFLEVEMKASIPSALLRIEFMVHRETGLVPGTWKIYERQPGGREWPERTKYYETDPDFLNVMKEVQDDIKSVSHFSKAVVISVTTTDPTVQFEIAGAGPSKSIGAGPNKSIGEGAEIKYLTGTIHETLAFPETYQFLLGIFKIAGAMSAEILAQIAAQYLYDAVKEKRDLKLKIGDSEVPVDKEKIEEAIRRYVV